MIIPCNAAMVIEACGWSQNCAAGRGAKSIYAIVGTAISGLTPNTFIKASACACIGRLSIGMPTAVLAR